MLLLGIPQLSRLNWRLQGITGQAEANADQLQLTTSAAIEPILPLNTHKHTCPFIYAKDKAEWMGAGGAATFDPWALAAAAISLPICYINRSTKPNTKSSSQTHLPGNLLRAQNFNFLLPARNREQKRSNSLLTHICILNEHENNKTKIKQKELQNQVKQANSRNGFGQFSTRYPNLCGRNTL